MTCILAFDTAGPYCAAALLKDVDVVTKSEEMARGQAERLMTMLQEFLQYNSTSWADLTAIGVGIGPGNFTGIRIGVAAAKGLSMGLSIPLHGVDGFEQRKRLGLAPVISAPRQQIYIFDHGVPRMISSQNSSLAPSQPDPDQIARAIAEDTVARGLDAPNPAAPL